MPRPPPVTPALPWSCLRPGPWAADQKMCRPSASSASTGRRRRSCWKRSHCRGQCPWWAAGGQGEGTKLRLGAPRCMTDLLLSLSVHYLPPTVTSLHQALRSLTRLSPQPRPYLFHPGPIVTFLSSPAVVMFPLLRALHGSQIPEDEVGTWLCIQGLCD